VYGIRVLRETMDATTVIIRNPAMMVSAEAIPVFLPSGVGAAS
jgi:hypothetical protein